MWIPILRRKRTKLTIRDRIEQAILLLTRLNDEDIADERARRSVNTIERDGTDLDACIRLYFAWCSITVTAKKIYDMGYELDQRWEGGLRSAHEHIMNLCVGQLSDADAALFERNAPTIFSNALHLNPYVDMAACVEDLNFAEHT